MRSCRLVGGGGGVRRPGLDGPASGTEVVPDGGREILLGCSLFFVLGFIWLRRLARGGVGGLFDCDAFRLSDASLGSASSGKDREVAVVEGGDVFSGRGSRLGVCSAEEGSNSSVSVSCEDEVVVGLGGASGLINFPRRVLGGGGFDLFSPEGVLV
jgi:hypothetical protein